MEDTSQELRSYQLSYLFPSSMTGESSAHAREELMKTLQGQDARITQSSELSKRKLAYPMTKQTFAFAGKIVFLAQPNTIPALNKSLRNQEGLLRFVVLKKEETEISAIGRREERFAQQEERANEEGKQMTDASVGYAREDDAAADQGPKNKEEMPRKEREKITIEDIDRKLDEIMKNIQ